MIQKNLQNFTIKENGCRRSLFLLFETVSYAVIQNRFLLNKWFLFEKSMALSNDSSLSVLKQNIANKNVDDAYYSETSPNDTSLIIVSVQSRDILECL